ncbi:MAG: FlgD immunoglobulin-like domain containing protein [bacterium]
MHKPQRSILMLFVFVACAGTVRSQDPFAWTHSSIGGGGFCLEIRFAPSGFFNMPNSRTLYLATDVSGVYRSNAMDASGEVTQWKRLIDPNPPANEKDPLPPYTTALAFTEKFQGLANNHRLIVGTTEGIVIWNETNSSWRAPATQPDRTSLASQSITMDSKDGKYPTIGVIRQCPPNTRYLTAGIGETRDDNATDFGRFGLSAVLRSSDGGDNWTMVRIPQAVRVEDYEEVHDLDFIIHRNTLNQDIDYSFITSDYGIYIMYDSVSTVTGQPFKVNFRRISPDTTVAKHWRGAVVLGKSAGAVQTVDDTLLVFASRRDATGATAVYRMTAARLASLLNPNYTPVWNAEGSGWESFIGKIAADPRSTRNEYQVFVGKPNSVALCVRGDSVTSWYKIYQNANANNTDNGYRLDKNFLKFGSFDFNPADTLKSPNIYGAWSYGPFISKGNSKSYRAARKIEQMFTQVANTVDDTYYESRADVNVVAVDEINFTSCMVTFHPTHPDTVMVGCPDNGLLRSHDGGLSWSHRRLRDKGEWADDYGERQEVYHIAYHRLNHNIVVASAGPVGVQEGELLKNTIGGRGGEDDWHTIAGGSPNGSMNLPNGSIRTFTFDVKGDRRGVFVGLQNRGLYYGKIDSVTGEVVGSFQQISDATLTSKIPASTGGHQNYSRILFDATDATNDYLYVARGWGAGGVFRLKLVSNRTNLDPTNCIESVDEVIKGRYTGSSPPGGSPNQNRAADVISLLITSTHVFAGVSAGQSTSQQDDTWGSNYVGGLIRWTKPTPPGPTDNNTWIVGGPSQAPNTTTSMLISIGALAQDHQFPDTIWFMTNRYPLTNNNSADASNKKWHGEYNDRVINLWRYTTHDSNALKITSSSMAFPSAVTMAFFPPGSDKIIAPTRGNGIWIGHRSYEGSRKLSPVVSAMDSAKIASLWPKRFALHANYPNPFNPSTTIKYDLPKATHVVLRIFDVVGRRVKTLIDEEKNAGYHHLVWDGTNQEGRPVASGVYFYRLETASFTKIRKTMLLR